MLDDEKVEKFVDIVEGLRKYGRNKTQIANQLGLRNVKGGVSAALLEEYYATAIRYLAYRTIIKWHWHPNGREEFEKSLALASAIDGKIRKEALVITEAYGYSRKNYEEALEIIGFNRYLNENEDVYTVKRIV